jgi:predicted dehydrogenase
VSFGGGVSPLRVALVGCGHMGRHHARVIASHPECALIATVDLVHGRAAELAVLHGGVAADAVPDEADVVVVATPTTTHAQVALPLIEAGKAVLVEKPLSHDVLSADLLKTAAAATGRLVVGHIERFNPGIRALGDHRPARFSAWRVSPPSERCADVDAVLDLMVHDIDLALWWMGPVRQVEATGLCVENNRLEGAVARLHCERGVATVVASRRGKASMRRLVAGEVQVDLMSGRAWRGEQELLPPDRDDALTAQWSAFVQSLGAPGPDVGDPAAGARAVQVAERVRAACLG